MKTLMLITLTLLSAAQAFAVEKSLRDTDMAGVHCDLDPQKNLQSVGSDQGTPQESTASDANS